MVNLVQLSKFLSKNAFYFCNLCINKDAISKIITTFVIETQCIKYNGRNYHLKCRY